MDSIFQEVNLGIEEISKSIDFDTAIFYIFGTQFFLIICGMIVMVLGESLLKSVTAQGLFFGGLALIIPYFSTLVTILLVILMDVIGVLLLRSSMSKRAFVRKNKQEKKKPGERQAQEEKSQSTEAKKKVSAPKEVTLKQAKREQGRSFQSKGKKQRRKTSHRKSSNARRQKR